MLNKTYAHSSYGLSVRFRSVGLQTPSTTCMAYRLANILKIISSSLVMRLGKTERDFCTIAGKEKPCSFATDESSDFY